MQNTDFNHLQCADEKIHIPGAIQPHGVLIAVLESTLSIVQASESAFTIFGIACEDLIGQPIKTLIGEKQQAELASKTLLAPSLLNPLRLDVCCATGQKKFDVAIHRVNGLLIIEFEECADLLPESSLDFFRTSNQAIAQLMACTSQQQLFQSAAEFVRLLTSFDRVMIYMFDAEWNGTVLAESKATEAKSYLGLRFPASDIPAQARELYKRNRLRLLANVAAAPSPIRSANSSHSSEPLDLSESILRAMSPVHIEYLTNMGVAASMSLSLISNGELRGLIACHHTTAKYVDYRVRQACDFLARLVSLQSDAIQERETFKALESFREARQNLLLQISGQDDLPAAIAGASTLLDIAGASGAAVVWDQQYFLVGTTPDKKQITKLVSALSNTILPVFVTDSLLKSLPSVESMVNCASGLIAIRLTQNDSKWLLWFRPQLLEEVSWAGKNDELLEMGDANARLQPRKSFELWKEIVTGRSAPWLSSAVQSVVELKAEILNLVLANADRKYAADLVLQVKALDALSQELLVTRDAALEASKRKSEMISVVSHDLRAPLSSIKGSLSLLSNGFCEIDSTGTELTSMAYASCDYLLNLINDLLDLESIESGGITLKESEVSVRQLVDEAFQLVRSAAEDKCISLIAEVGTMTVFADKERLLQVLVNLISNAIKFSPADTRIIVNAQSSNGMVNFSVADQGRGIPPELRQ